VVTLQFAKARHSIASTGSRARWAVPTQIGPPDVTSAISAAGRGREQFVEEVCHPPVELANRLTAGVPVVDIGPAAAARRSALSRDLVRNPSFVEAEIALAQRPRRSDLEPEYIPERYRGLNGPA
jgi:hypothetical protein